MANEKLKHVTELAAEFKNAVEARYQGDRKLGEKLIATLKPGEMEGIQDKLQEIVNEALEYAFGGEPSEAFIKKNLALVDITAELFSRVLPAEKLSPLVPAELKTEENVAYLRELGAANLANVSAFKPK